MNAITAKDIEPEEQDSQALMERTLLLVDDEKNILSSLARLFRKDNYRILKANGGHEGLKLLEDNEVGVIISDQRMPEMTGTEFFNKVKHIRPNSVRIILSGYTDLKTVTDAINEGAIYKFLTKPWDGELLRENVRKAFEHHELVRENDRLTQELRKANERFAQINQNLEQRVEIKTREVMINMRNLQVSQDILQNIPFAVIGFSSQGKIASANKVAHQILEEKNDLVGKNIVDVMPERFKEYFSGKGGLEITSGELVLHNGEEYSLLIKQFDESSTLKGWVMALV